MSQQIFPQPLELLRVHPSAGFTRFLRIERYKVITTMVKAVKMRCVGEDGALPMTDGKPSCHRDAIIRWTGQLSDASAAQQRVRRRVLLGRRPTAAVRQIWANEVAADDDERWTGPEPVDNAKHAGECRVRVQLPASARGLELRARHNVRVC